MPASYPSSVRVFSTKVNITDIVDASHPNTVQEEVVAIQTVLGTLPNVSTTPNPAGTFQATSTSFSTLNARLANIETGIVADTHTQYPKRENGTVTTASTSQGVIRNIHVSTNTPTGGIDGDVWLRYS